MTDKDQKSEREDLADLFQETLGDWQAKYWILIDKIIERRKGEDRNG